VQDKKLYRNALLLEKLTQGYDSELFSNVNLSVEVAERIAIIGQNGVGKTTLLETIMGNLAAKSGTIKWSENANIGYYAQNHNKEFASKTSLLEWMMQWRKPEDDEQAIRGILGRMLFSRHDINKPVNVLSGGEQGRMLLGKLILQQPNILVMDEPTNHMDMESIEALNLALENYPGTLLFVSHDRQFVSSLANRIIEIKANNIIDFSGSYDDYLASQEN
jgi:ATPase subunit of ABC transporter with duplicated ATPase domains